jgi:ABC-type glycerol-3-phosphate transport system permease component
MKRLFSSSNPFKPSPATMIVSYILLLFWTFLVLFPIYWLLVTAFKLPIDVNTGPKYLMYVDFHPSTHAWREMFVESGNLVTRPYKNTAIIGFVSAVFALVLGSGASYALSRFTFRPKLGLILAFVMCMVLMMVMINLDVPWQVAAAASIGIFLLIALTIGRRFKGTMTNDDIAFWLISQRMLPPVAVLVPIYILFQNFGLLNTYTALIVTYTAVNLPLAVCTRARGHVPDRVDLRLERIHFGSVPFWRGYPDTADVGRRPECNPRSSVVEYLGAGTGNDRARCCSLYYPGTLHFSGYSDRSSKRMTNFRVIFFPVVKRERG